MTSKKKVKKLPKPGSWKAIEHELESQGAIGNFDVEDGDSFLVYGKFTQSVLNAFTDRHQFSVEPVSALLVFKNNRRIKERLRFGGASYYQPIVCYILSGGRLHWRMDTWRFYPKDDRYICRCDSGCTLYYYMDRVI